MSGCGGEGGTMLPGSNCLACHDGSNGEAPKYNVAGTVFADSVGSAPAVGAIVRVTDANGSVIELTTNSAGNFYTSQPVAFPISAEVELDGNVLQMGTTPSNGACNACHACTGTVGAKIYAQ